MISIRVISDFRADAPEAQEITKESKEKWGDEVGFLKQLLSKAEIAGIAAKNGSIVGFSVARRIVSAKGIAIAFLATRVLAEYRNKGIAKILIKRITRNFIIKNKFLNIFNWFKPVYFVTATANPIVFENFRKYLKIFPSLKPHHPDDIELNIAERFAGIFASKEKFNQQNFVLSAAFLNSAESYARQEDIPWSNNAETNAFLEDRIKLKERTGNGLVVIVKIL